MHTTIALNSQARCRCRHRHHRLRLFHFAFPLVRIAGDFSKHFNRILWMRAVDSVHANVVSACKFAESNPINAKEKWMCANVMYNICVFRSFWPHLEICSVAFLFAYCDFVAFSFVAITVVVIAPVRADSFSVSGNSYTTSKRVLIFYIYEVWLDEVLIEAFYMCYALSLHKIFKNLERGLEQA